MLGICNGFQILCEAGLLPGVLRPNASLRFVCRDVASASSAQHRRSPRAATPGQRLVDPVKHGEGCYVRSARSSSTSSSGQGQIVLRYEAGRQPERSHADIAGIVNAEGNVMGLMPHPEHAVDPLLGSTDGTLVLGSLVDAARERRLVSASA